MMLSRLNFLRKKYLISFYLDKGKAFYFDSEEIFDSLQNKYNGTTEYGYSNVANWQRAIERVLYLSKIVDFNNIINVLEIGCGDGMTSKLLTDFGLSVKAIDIEDWREKRCKSINFIQHDLNNPLPFQNEEFDLIISYNTFEHLPDLNFVMKEVLRVAKSNSHIFLDFGPLYNSPWGLHAHRSFNMPYPQFLFSEEFISKKLKTMEHSDLGRKMSNLQYTNKWSLNEYRRLWRNEMVEIISELLTFDYKYLNFVFKFIKAFSGKNLQFEDIVSQSIRILLKKK